MSKYNNGILGPFSGRVGNVVGSKWKYQFVMRARPYRKQEVQPSVRQLSQRERFGLMAEAMRPLAGAINTGFSFDAKVKSMTVRNVAMSENMTNAMTQSGGSWAIDPALVVVARGAYGNVNTLTASYSANAMNLSWANNAGAVIGILPSGNTVALADNDQVLTVIWNATKKEARYDIFTTGVRDDMAATLNKPADWVAADDVYAIVFTMPELVYKYLRGTASDDEAKEAQELIENGYGVSTSASVKIPIV